MTFKVLTIAGFDGSGGAGIQADLKTFSALGCYGATVLTALPIQNTCGVREIYDVSARCVEEQLVAIFEDIKLDAVKIGMLHRLEIIASVTSILLKYNPGKIVLDPVMTAKSGDLLLLPDAIALMKEQLFPIITLLTPNLPETSILLGREVTVKSQMEEAAVDLLKMGLQAVVVKGGHLQGSCDDCLRLGGTTHWFPAPRIPTKNTHGTGCTFSAAIASLLAKGCSIIEAVSHAKQYLIDSIEAGARLDIGQGKGPVHHFHHLWSFL